MESDPIGLMGGSYSTYSYVNSNPISRSDPLGLFLYDIHWQLTYNATGLAGLADLVAGVDSEPGSQYPGFSDMHAMRAPWETPEQGEQNYNWYLQSELSKCSIQGLAHALHAAQDSASASHQGFQVWDGGSFGVHFPGFSHMWHDAFPTPQEWSNATQNTQAILNQFKSTCGCGK